MPRPCPDIEPLIAEVLFGEPTDGERTRLKAHLDGCPACAEEVRALEATLSLTAEHAPPEPPEGFFDDYWERLQGRMAREAAHGLRRAEAAEPPAAASHEGGLRALRRLAARLRAGWQRLTAPVPSAVWQGALAVLLLGVGFFLGRAPATTRPFAEAPLAGDATTDADLRDAASTSEGALDDLMLASRTVETDGGSTVRPSLVQVEDITYDLSAGTVEIRYHTVNDIVLRGRPDDPRIQRLLEAAMLDDGNPAARLHALRTVERARPAADPEVVRALTYLVRSEIDPGMRLRAVRALGALYRDRAPDGPARDALVDVLLDDSTTALRSEALRALTRHAAQADGAGGRTPQDDALARVLRRVGQDSTSAVGLQALRALGDPAASSLPPDADDPAPLNVP
jgi:hypothetical protein